jgi:hypothetical protein
MPGQKGNKNAIGNNGGRPRKFDLVEEAKAFKEWADKPDSLVLRKFAAVRGYDCQSRLNDYANESVEFGQAFKYAKIMIGARREELLVKGKGHPAPFMRYAAIYDPELKRHEQDIKTQEALVNSNLKVQIVDFKNAS